MFKTINKFSRLTIVFTVLYILSGVFLLLLSLSEIYPVSTPFEWIPTFVYGNKLLLHLVLSIPNYLFWILSTLILGLVITAIVLGIRAIKQTSKTKEKGRWIALLLTTLNIFLLIILVPIAFIL
ncbi:MAG TPA: hypothetical protein VJG67_00760 [Candidatus Paceibacterota bacterium]